MDLIYTRVEHHPPGSARWARSPYRQLLGSPLMVWEFNTVPEFGYVIGRSQCDVEGAIEGFRSAARGCDLAICVSGALADYVQANLGIERVLTVPNGSDPDLFRPDASPEQSVQRRSGQLNVVWIGSADLPWHNLDLLRETARRLWVAGERMRILFHVIGEGLPRTHDLPPNVHYHGAERYERLPHWLSAMDVGLVLYRSGPADYSSPIKLFDYMASGLTVVATEQPQVRHVFGQLGQLDLLLPRDDHEALASTLLSLAANLQRVRHQGELGRRLVIDHYNWNRAVRHTLAGVEMILQDRGLDTAR
jgi:glycosyltransferase involved in cell wall biosynthesis